MTVYNLANFATAVVSTGYDASATSIVVDDASSLPSVPFNAVWHNSTDYPNPADDPNVEIVRVTNLVSVTLTVTRAQEATSASTKNTAGKVYRINVPLTLASVDGFLNSNTSSGNFETGDTPNTVTQVDINNSRTGDSGAHSVLRCIVGGATSGDALATFSTQVQNWSVGVDNSATDEFKISSTADLGNEDRIRIGTDGHITLGDSTPSSIYSVRINETDLADAGVLIAHDAGTGDALLAIHTDDGGGDCYLNLRQRGSPDIDWAIGLDDTDDSYQICAGTALGSNVALRVHHADLASIVGGPLAFATSELTIATGAVTVTGSHHTVDTESDAATDDLDTINGGSYDGQLLLLQAADDARTVVLKHGTGNLALTGAADFSLDAAVDTALLMWSSASSTWCAVALTSNG